MMLASGNASARARVHMVAIGADETKYDGRHMRATLSRLQRLVLVIMALLLVVVVIGDSAMLSSLRLRGGEGFDSALTTQKREPLPGARAVRKDTNLFVLVEEEGKEARGGGEAEVAKQPNAEDAEADVWGGAPEGHSVETAGAQPPPHDGRADPALAELAEAVRREGEGEHAQPNAEAHGVPENAPIASVVGARGLGGAVGGGAGRGAVGLNDMPDPAADWSLTTDTKSCSGYFGNGFTDERVLVGRAETEMGGSGPRLTCWHHPETHAYYCTGHDLVLHPDRIEMTRGGEDLSSVMGRSEDSELPTWGSGALEIFLGDVNTLSSEVAAREFVTPQNVESVDAVPLTTLPGVPALVSEMLANDPYKSRMLSHARVISPRATDSGPGGSPAPRCFVINEPVVFVTRVEYANLFHTTTGARAWALLCAPPCAGHPTR